MPVSNATISGADDENPSWRLYGAGSNSMPSMFFGSVPAGTLILRPVAVVESSTSNTAEGHGVMQRVPPSGLQLSGVARSRSLPPQAVSRSVVTSSVRMARTLAIGQRGEQE